MNRTPAKPLVLASAIAGLLLIPACTSEADPSDSEPTTTQEESTRTLAASLGELPDMATLNGAISSAELSSIFDGPGSYTLLAPNDAAFAALGAQGKTLMDEAQRPVLIGVLREHILPGHVTPESITEAIQNQGGEVTMTTLGGGEVVFTVDRDTITVSHDTGASARLASSATAATNGVIIPIDKVLVPAESEER